VFLETIHPPQSLVIFGGGSDVTPVLELARTLGWHVTIVAGRAATTDAGRFAQADVFCRAEADDPTGGIVPGPDAAVVLMTHDYPRDARILAALADRPISYLGVLGPRSRAERLLAGASGSEGWNLFFPIGLDLGADSPERIALAIVAEIQAALSGRPGGMLRDRPGPIYPREARPS
jgi:xanthine/CO dehydrogenase XdhC/CoxF family maturation factor